MVRKKIDNRIRVLVENCVAQRHRSLFVIVGDKGRDQVVNLHYMLSKSLVKARPTVLWCYKNQLHLSSHTQKRVRQIKKKMVQGLLDPEKEDIFSLFVAGTDISYCYYHESERILGRTFGMCVLQDFEGVTPNLLARTMETVEGGGIVVLLLSTMASLRDLYTLTMDVHKRLQTPSHQTITARFNERLVLSLATNPAALLMDDEMNVLPTSTHVKSIKALPRDEEGRVILDGPSETAAAELSDLRASLADTQPAGALVAKCRTMDQARAVVTFLDAASEKTLRATVALTAARGRGKSAALGLAIAGALSMGYANIFVTAPSPENLKTLFEFAVVGLQQMEYKEHLDFDLVKSSNSDFKGAIVRMNVFRNHRQTVQYIQPKHHARLAAAELLIIDEAAAIPLPLVQAMLGPYLVFLCSTVNGYEGTGRSLSLKLLQKLRDNGAKVDSQPSDTTGGGGNAGGRTFREVVLSEPIRYAAGDKVEAWLHQLLCLDAAEHLPSPPARLPAPSECNLWYVQRDTLFSGHAAAETVLQSLMSLYVASHYRNTPDDLLMLADAPAHHLFALLGPVDEAQNAVPHILAVVQVALEGSITKGLAEASLSRGHLPQGDMIPWVVGQQFQDADFPRLSGARIVRIAVHPSLTRGGYGSRAVELLQHYYEGHLADLSEDGCDGDKSAARPVDLPSGKGGLLDEIVRPRAGLPPLLQAVSERPAEALQYLGASFGMTQPLLSFWRRNGFVPLYLRQTASNVTGEHTCIVVKPMRNGEVKGVAWAEPFVADFRVRLMAMLPSAFRHFSPVLTLTLLDPKLQSSAEEMAAGVDAASVVSRADGTPMTPHDLRRLQAYSNSLVDYHMVLDLVPGLAGAFFSRRLPASLTYGQAALLAGVGLQRLEVDSVGHHLDLKPPQTKALFDKMMRRLYDQLRMAAEAGVARTLPLPQTASIAPQQPNLDDELDEAAQAVRSKMQAELDPQLLAEFAVRGAEADFDAALGKKVPTRGILSVKSSAPTSATADVADDEPAENGVKQARKPKSASDQKAQMYKRTNGKQSHNSSATKRRKK